MYLEAEEHDEDETEFDEKVICGSDSEGTVYLNSEKPMELNQVNGEDEEEEGKEIRSPRESREKERTRAHKAIKEKLDKRIVTGGRLHNLRIR